MCSSAPGLPVQWAQRLRRVFAIDIETCPERRLNTGDGLRAAQEEPGVCRSARAVGNSGSLPASDCRDAGGRATQEQLPRGPTADCEDSRPRPAASSFDRQCSARTTRQPTAHPDANLIAWATRPERHSATTSKWRHPGPACRSSADLAVTFRMVHRTRGNPSQTNVPLPILA
jgi:hypothetical protein